MPANISQVIKFLKVIQNDAELIVKNSTCVCDLMAMVEMKNHHTIYVHANTHPIKNLKEMWIHIKSCRHCSGIKNEVIKTGYFFDFRITQNRIELKLISREEFLRKMKDKLAFRRTKTLEL